MSHLMLRRRREKPFGMGKEGLTVIARSVRHCRGIEGDFLTRKPDYGGLVGPYDFKPGPDLPGAVVGKLPRVGAWSGLPHPSFLHPFLLKPAQYGSGIIKIVIADLLYQAFQFFFIGRIRGKTGVDLSEPVF